MSPSMKKNLFFKFTKIQSKRVKKNFFATFSNFSIQILIQIIYPPLMLFFWGIENFGIWVFITAIPSTLALLNVNFSSAAKVEMSINDAKNKKNLVNEIFHNGFGLILMNMTIFTIIWLSLYLLIDLNLKIFENIGPNELRLTLLLIVLFFYFTIFDSILSTGIIYKGNLYISQNIKTIFDTSIKISIVISGIFFDSLIYAAIIFFIITILRTLVYYYYFTLHKKYIFLSLKLVNFKSSLKLFKLSLSYYSETLTTLMKHNGLIILFGIFFTAELVGLVSTAKTLFYFLPIRFLGIFSQTSIHEYSQAYGKNQTQILKHNYYRHILLTLLLMVIFIIGSLTIGPKIYNFWLNNKYNLDYFLLLVIVFDSVFYNLRDSISSIIRGVNKFFKPTIIETFLSILTILISYYYLTLGYSFIRIFLINLTATFISFIVFSYFSLKFYYKLK